MEDIRKAANDYIEFTFNKARDWKYFEISEVEFNEYNNGSFMQGVLSDAARDYWYSVFESKKTKKVKHIKTPVNSLIEWVDNINNSIFALQASEIELKMLTQFREKLVEMLPIEEEFAKQSFLAGFNFLEKYEDFDADATDFSDFMENYK